MRTIQVILQTDSTDSIEFISNDIRQELWCCSTWFEPELIKINEIKEYFNFCPNCEADMRGDDNETD